MLNLSKFRFFCITEKLLNVIIFYKNSIYTKKATFQLGLRNVAFLDYNVNFSSVIHTARRKIPESTVLMGNINPSTPLYLGTPEQVEKKVKEIIEKTKGKGVIISSGCALGANTKPENITAMIDATKKYGSYEQLMQLWEGKGE